MNWKIMFWQLVENMCCIAKLRPWNTSRYLKFTLWTYWVALTQLIVTYKLRQTRFWKLSSGNLLQCVTLFRAGNFFLFSARYFFKNRNLSYYLYPFLIPFLLHGASGLKMARYEGPNMTTTKSLNFKTL